jgi:hypothetical protein
MRWILFFVMTSLGMKIDLYPFDDDENVYQLFDEVGVFLKKSYHCWMSTMNDHVYGQFDDDYGDDVDAAFLIDEQTMMMIFYVEVMVIVTQISGGIVAEHHSQLLLEHHSQLRKNSVVTDIEIYEQLIPICFLLFPFVI